MLVDSLFQHPQGGPGRTGAQGGWRVRHHCRGRSSISHSGGTIRSEARYNSSNSPFFSIILKCFGIISRRSWRRSRRWVF